MRVVAVVALLGVALLPAVSAQGPPLDVENNTIWNQYTNDPACCTTFGSTLKDDPRFAGSGNYGTLYVLPAGTATSFSLGYPLTSQEFAYPVLLDPEGMVEFVVHVGAGTSTGGAAGVARVTVDASLTLGSTVVAAGSGTVVLDAAQVDGYKQVKYNVAPQVTRLDPADGELAWTIRITGAASGIYVSHTDANGNGWVTLPIIGTEGGGAAPDAPIVETLAQARLEHAFANATSASYLVNFTTAMVNSTAHFAWNGTAGNVSATLRDGNGTVVFNGTFAGNGTLDHAIADATAGTWNLTLAYADFNGTFAFELKQPTAADPGPGDDGTDSEPAPEGNGTADLASAPKDTPLPIVAPLLGVAAAIAVRRRR